MKTQKKLAALAAALGCAAISLNFYPYTRENHSKEGLQNLSSENVPSSLNVLATKAPTVGVSTLKKQTTTGTGSGSTTTCDGEGSNCSLKATLNIVFINSIRSGNIPGAISFLSTNYSEMSAYVPEAVLDGAISHNLDLSVTDDFDSYGIMHTNVFFKQTGATVFLLQY